MRHSVAVALVAAIALALAGCGSSERTETVASAQLVQRLASACRAGEQAGRSALKGNRGQVAFMLAQRESLRTTMDRIDHLEVTGAARRSFDAYKRTVRARIDALERVASADESDQQRALAAAMPAINAAATRAHSLALDIGEQLRMVCF
jgi:hypothetical protein